MELKATPQFATFFAVNLAASLHAASAIQFSAPSFTVAENAGQATVLGGNRRGGEGENGDPAAMNPSCPDFKSAQRTGELQNLADSTAPPPVAKRLGLR